MKLAIITFTSQGKKIVLKLAKHIKVDHYCKDTVKDFNLKSITEHIMSKYEGLIFVGATGIAVRAIAPYITYKDKDPAVVVIDNSCKYVISLLSGHLGGANQLSLDLAEILDAEPIITTATDNLSKVAPDILAKDNSLVIDNLKTAKVIASLLVEDKRVYFEDHRNLIELPSGYTKDLKEASGMVKVTNEKHFKINIEPCLKLVRKDIVLGIGCRKDYDPHKMKDKVLEVLTKHNIDIRAIKSIGTVEVKKDERAILELAEFLNCELKIFSIEEIKEVQGKYKGSDFVEKTIGVRAVCEPCVELLEAKCLTEKLSLEGMTLCLGQLESDK